ncbi:MAG TPA: RNA-binding protein S1 [Peptococcaceae bacterium]|nr:MAG: RNA binding S1 [Clostridia bacterium 41_269]HBT20672.1 RNA-binding protein S1 [Peptococcaceae bacterium]
MSLAVGSIVEGVVTGITKFGAFVELPGGITGLIHISEVADTYVKDVSDYLKMQQQVKAKVIRIGEDGKVALSIKQLNSDNKKNEGSRSKRKNSNMSFEDKLAKFLKESDEKQQALRRNQESRRRSRTRRAY